MLDVFFKTACIFLISAAGFVLRRRNIIDTDFNRQLSLLQINVIYPALILSSQTRNFTWPTLLSNWPLPAGSAMIMMVGWAVGLAVMPLIRREPRPTRAMFHFQCMINNYSFLPIMLAATLLDEKGVAQIIFSALGAELVVWTFGLQALTGGNETAGASCGSGPLTRKERLAACARLIGSRLRNLASMPLLAMAAAAGWLLLRHHAGGTIDAVQATPLGGAVADMFSTALHMTGQATIPLAAIIVGSRCAEIKGDQLFAPLTVLTTFLRLVIIPALATLLLFWLPFPPAVRPALLIVAAQPCAMASVMFAEAYGCDARFAATTVLTTHVACLLTIPLWLSAPWW